MYCLIGTLLLNDLFLVEKEYFISPSLVENVLVDALLVLDIEGYWVGHVERVIAPKASFLRVIPERDDAKLVCISCQVGFSLTQLAIAILNKTIRIILAFYAILYFTHLVCLSFVEVLHFSFFLGNFLVFSFGRRLDYLDGDEAIGDFRVRYALHIAFFNSCKWNSLVIFTIKIIE